MSAPSRSAADHPSRVNLWKEILPFTSCYLCRACAHVGALFDRPPAVPCWYFCVPASSVSRLHLLWPLRAVSFPSLSSLFFMSQAKKAKTTHAMSAPSSSAADHPSWVEYDPSTCDFPIQNLPYGVFSPPGSGSVQPRVGVAIGNLVLDLAVLHETGMFQQLGTWTSCFCESTLNTFMGLGSARWNAARAAISRLLSKDEPALRDNVAVRKQALHPQSACKMHLPCRIGDYTDFYASREHATNVGTITAEGQRAAAELAHLPVGYHGRSSSVVVSGTPITRPKGQLQKNRPTPRRGRRLRAP